MGNDYVVRLMRAQCSMGTMENFLNLPLDHGVVGPGGEPLMNANDHQSGEHVIHFGRCNSNVNPGNITKKITGFLLPGLGAFTSLTKMIGCDGCKCKPKTFVPWINGNDQHIIEGAPALTTGSKLACFYGGVISILPPPPPEEEETPVDVAQTVAAAAVAGSANAMTK